MTSRRTDEAVAHGFAAAIPDRFDALVGPGRGERHGPAAPSGSEAGPQGQAGGRGRSLAAPGRGCPLPPSRLGWGRSQQTQGQVVARPRHGAGRPRVRTGHGWGGRGRPPVRPHARSAPQRPRALLGGCRGRRDHGRLHRPRTRPAAPLRRPLMSIAGAGGPGRSRACPDPSLRPRPRRARPGSSRRSNGPGSSRPGSSRGTAGARPRRRRRAGRRRSRS